MLTKYSTQIYHRQKNGKISVEENVFTFFYKRDEHIRNVLDVDVDQKGKEEVDSIANTLASDSCPMSP